MHTVTGCRFDCLVKQAVHRCQREPVIAVSLEGLLLTRGKVC